MIVAIRRNSYKTLPFRLKSETYNDIIGRLISAYEKEYLDDFIDEEAAYYNERIKQFERETMKELEKLI